MLRHRVLSALVGIPLIVFSAWYGGFLLLGFTAAIIFMGLRELSEMLAKMQLKPPVATMAIGSGFILGGVYLGGDRAIGPVITLLVIFTLLTVVFRFPACTPADGAAGLLGTLYLGLFIYFYLLRTLPHGWVWLLLLLVATWASDTAAYFVGKKFGRRKLAPALSPGKTVAGALGGAGGSLAAAWIFTLAYPFLPVAQVLLLGLLIGIAGQLGDLWESVLKRTAGIKDTGALIPGHGGVLDRFDSMLFTAPLVYYFLVWFIIS